MKKILWIAMLVLLVGCAKEPEGLKINPSENKKPDIAEKEEIPESLDEKENVEEGVETEEPVDVPETSLLSKHFFEEMKAGIMPGSKIQFTDNAGDIKEMLGEPNEETGYEGAMIFVYNDFSYAVPFDWAEDDAIILIVKPIDKPLTASQLIDAWGEPTEQGELYSSDPGVFSYSYLFDNHVINFMSDGGLDGEVKAISMQQLN